MSLDNESQKIAESQTGSPKESSVSLSRWHEERHADMLVAFAQLPKAKEAAKAKDAPAKATDDWETIPLGVLPATDISKMPDKDAKRVEYEEMQDDGTKVKGWKFEDNGKIAGQNIDYKTTWHWSLDKKLLDVQTVYTESGAKESSKGLSTTVKDVPDYARQNLKMVTIEPTINDGQPGYYCTYLSYPTKDEKAGDYLVTETRCFVDSNGKVVSRDMLIDEADLSKQDDDYRYSCNFFKSIGHYSDIKVEDETHQMQGVNLKSHTRYDGDNDKILLHQEVAEDGKPINKTVYDYRNPIKPMRYEIAFDSDGHPRTRLDYELTSNKAKRKLDYTQNGNNTVVKKETVNGYLGDSRNLVTTFSPDGKIGLMRAVIIPAVNGQPDKRESLLTYDTKSKKIKFEAFELSSQKLLSRAILGPDNKGKYRTENVQITEPITGILHEITYKDGHLPFIFGDKDSNGAASIIGIQDRFRKLNGTEVPEEMLKPIFTSGQHAEALQKLLTEIQKSSK